MACWTRCKINVTCCLFLALTLVQTASANESDLPIPDEQQATFIGERIFANECNRNIDCLTSWNEGEDFPSLGIGHFIWFRQGQDERFQESFPALLDYYDELGVTLPGWIDEYRDRGAPWPTREAFLAERDGERLTSLREFFVDTKAVQAQFIIQRLYTSVPDIIAAADDPEGVADMFARIARTQPPLGMYALIDYVNFKGEGILATERYRGEGWGLLQVIEHMLAYPSDAPIMRQFADASSAVLRRRVENAPSERNEERWLQGWYNRSETYAGLPN